MTPIATQLSPEKVVHQLETFMARPSGNQRLRARFPIDLPLSYRTLGRKLRSGAGRVVNISSNDVTVACSHGLTAGTPVELTIEWPARLDGSTPLNLIMTGKTARCEPSGFAVASCRYRFMLAGRKPAPDRVAPADDVDHPVPAAVFPSDHLSSRDGARSVSGVQSGISRSKTSSGR